MRAITISLLFCSMSFASVLEDAEKGIEQHRKANVAIEVRSPDGSPLANARVNVQQISHDFHFGNYIRPRHYDNPTYLNRFKDVFNSVQLLEFNWGQYEPDEGKPLLKQRRDFIEDWCIPNGLDHFYGHMLVWTRQYDAYPRTGLPVWLFNYDKAKQYELLKGRIQREVSAYRDINLDFDVVNEAVHCRVWGDWDKDSYLQNRQAEPLDRIVPYVRDALTWAHEANPKDSTPDQRLPGHRRRPIPAPVQSSDRPACCRESSSVSDWYPSPRAVQGEILVLPG